MSLVGVSTTLNAPASLLRIPESLSALIPNGGSATGNPVRLATKTASVSAVKTWLLWVLLLIAIAGLVAWGAIAIAGRTGTTPV